MSIVGDFCLINDTLYIVSNKRNVKSVYIEAINLVIQPESYFKVDPFNGIMLVCAKHKDGTFDFIEYDERADERDTQEYNNWKRIQKIQTEYNKIKIRFFSG